jgi:hypothetical protein
MTSAPTLNAEWSGTRGLRGAYKLRRTPWPAILPSQLSQSGRCSLTHSLSGGGPAFHNSFNVVMPLMGAGCKSSKWCVVCQTEPEHKGRWSLKSHLMKVHNLDMLPSCSKCTVPYVREQWDDITKHYVSDHGGKDENSVLWLLVPCKRPGESYLDINYTPLCYVPFGCGRGSV